MALSTSQRVAFGLALAAIGVVGFAAASGKFSTPISPPATVAALPSQTQQAQTQPTTPSVLPATQVKVDDTRRDDRVAQGSEIRIIETRVDAKTGAVISQSERRNDHYSGEDRHEREDNREHGEYSESGEERERH
jgi:hypothetical protein